MLLRWNGVAWKRVPSPEFPHGSALIGVTAGTSRSTWAVGFTGRLFSSGARTLILRWNGSAWH